MTTVLNPPTHTITDHTPAPTARVRRGRVWAALAGTILALGVAGGTVDHATDTHTVAIAAADQTRADAYTAADGTAEPRARRQRIAIDQADYGITTAPTDGEIRAAADDAATQVRDRCETTVLGERIFTYTINGAPATCDQTAAYERDRVTTEKEAILTAHETDKEAAQTKLDAIDHARDNAHAAAATAHTNTVHAANTARNGWYVGTALGFFVMLAPVWVWATRREGARA